MPLSPYRPGQTDPLRAPTAEELGPATIDYAPPQPPQQEPPAPLGPPPAPAEVKPEDFPQNPFAKDQSTASMQKAFDAYVRSYANPDSVLNDEAALKAAKKLFADKWATDQTYRLPPKDGKRYYTKLKRDMAAALAGYNPAAAKARSEELAAEANTRNKAEYRQKLQEYEGSATGDVARAFGSSLLNATASTIDFFNNLAKEASKANKAYDLYEQGKLTKDALELISVQTNKDWEKNWAYSLANWLREGGESVSEGMSQKIKDDIARLGQKFDAGDYAGIATDITTNPRLATVLGAQSAGFVVGSGGLVGGGRMAAIKALGMAVKMNKVAKAGRITRALSTTAIAGAQAEDAARATRQAIEKTPLNALRATPAYAHVYDLYQKEHGRAPSQEEMRSMLIESQTRVARVLGFGAGVIGMHLGHLSETGLLGLATRAGRQAVAKGLGEGVKGTLRAAGREAASEFVEEGAVQHAQDIASKGKSYTAFLSKPSKQAIGQGVAGAVLGGFMGGGVAVTAKALGGDAETGGTKGSSKPGKSPSGEPTDFFSDEDLAAAKQAADASLSAQRAAVTKDKVSANVVLGRSQNPKAYDGAAVPPDAVPIAWDKENNITIHEWGDGSINYTATDDDGAPAFTEQTDQQALALAQRVAELENDPEIINKVEQGIQARKQAVAQVADPAADTTPTVQPKPEVLHAAPDIASDIMSDEEAEQLISSVAAASSEEVSSTLDDMTVATPSQPDPGEVKQALSDLLSGAPPAALEVAMNPEDQPPLLTPEEVRTTFRRALLDKKLSNGQYGNPVPPEFAADITTARAASGVKAGTSAQALSLFGENKSDLIATMENPAKLPMAYRSGPAIEETDSATAAANAWVDVGRASGITEPDVLLEQALQLFPEANAEDVVMYAEQAAKEEPVISLHDAQTIYAEEVKAYGKAIDDALVKENRAPEELDSPIPFNELEQVARLATAKLKHRGVGIMPVLNPNDPNVLTWAQGRTRYKALLAYQPQTGQSVILLNHKYIKDAADARQALNHEILHMGLRSVVNSGEYAKLMRDAELLGRRGSKSLRRLWKEISKAYEDEPVQVRAEEFLVEAANRGLLKRNKNLAERLRVFARDNLGMKFASSAELEDFAQGLRTAIGHASAHSHLERFIAANAATTPTFKDLRSYDFLAQREAAIQADLTNWALGITSKTGYVRLLQSAAKSAFGEESAVAQALVKLTRSTLRLPSRLHQAANMVEQRYWAPIEEELALLRDRTGIDEIKLTKRVNKLLQAEHAAERNLMWWLVHSPLKDNDAEQKRADIVQGIASGRYPASDYQSVLLPHVQATAKQTLAEVAAAGMTNEQAREIIAYAKSAESNNFYGMTKNLRKHVRELVDNNLQNMIKSGQYDPSAVRMLKAYDWQHYVPLKEIDPESSVYMPLDAWNPSNFQSKAIDIGSPRAAGQDDGFQILHFLREANRSAAQDVETGLVMQDMYHAVTEWNKAAALSKETIQPLGSTIPRKATEYVAGKYETDPTTKATTYVKPKFEVVDPHSVANRRTYTARMPDGRVVDLKLDPELGNVYSSKLDLSWELKHKSKLANRLERAGRRGTRAFSMAQTSLRPFFLPMALIRESIQAASNAGLDGTRGVVKGTLVAGDVFVRSFARAFNPTSWKLMTRYFYADVVEREKIVQEMAKYPSLKGFVERHKRGDIIHFQDKLRINDLAARSAAQQFAAQGLWQSTKAGAKALVDGMDAIASVFDNIPRQAAYDALVAHGMDKDTASYRSRVLMDFHQRSDAGQTLNAFWAFSQAALTGADKFFTRDLWKGAELGFEWELGADGKLRPNIRKSWKNLNWAGMAVHTLIGAGSTYMLASALGADQDDPDDRPMIEKLNASNIIGYRLIPTGDAEPIRISSGFGIPQIFEAIGSALALKALGTHTDGDINSALLGVFYRNVAPVGTGQLFSNFTELQNPLQQGIVEMSPTVLAPVVQHLMNLNAFGSRVHNEPFMRNDKKAKYELAKSSTLDTYIEMSRYFKQNYTGVLGKYADIYPETFQHYVGSYLGVARDAQNIVRALRQAPYEGRDAMTEALNRSFTPFVTTKDARYRWTNAYYRNLDAYYKELLPMYQAMGSKDRDLGYKGDKGPNVQAFLKDHPEFKPIKKLDSKMRRTSLRSKMIHAKLNHDYQLYNELHHQNVQRYKDAVLELRGYLKAAGLRPR